MSYNAVYQPDSTDRMSKILHNLNESREATSIDESKDELVSNNGSSMNESAKIRNMTKPLPGMVGYKLPSGKPGLVAEAGDFILSVAGTEEEGIDIILETKAGSSWFLNFDTDENGAVKKFKEIAGDLSDLIDPSRLAKKYGMEASW